MKGRAIIPLVVGLGIGLLAIKLGFDYISKAKGNAVDTDVVRIVTANKDISITSQISRDMLATAEIPHALLPAQYIPEENIKQVVGRVAGVMMSKGNPLTERMLAPEGTPPGLVCRIPPGYRAISVRVAEEQQAGGWVVPGAHVDVSAIFTVKKPGSNRTYIVSKVILEDIEVVAVGQMLGSEAKEPGANVVKSVTLLVKAADVPKLHYAQTKGKVTFAVRSQNDGADGKMASIDEDEFFNLGKPQSEKDQANDQGQPSEGDKPSLLSNLLAAAMTRTVTGDGATSTEANEPAAPFKVEVINGQDQIEKIYENQWSREELEDDRSKIRKK